MLNKIVFWVDAGRILLKHIKNAEEEITNYFNNTDNSDKPANNLRIEQDKKEETNTKTKA